MVDNSKLLIAVNSNKNGGTQRTLQYAKSLNRDIIIIEPMEFYK